MASVADQLRVAEYLIKHGADVDSICQAQTCSLSVLCDYAIMNERADVIQLLMKHGADPHARGRRGKSPVECAREKGEKMLKLLMSEP